MTLFWLLRIAEVTHCFWNWLTGFFVLSSVTQLAFLRKGSCWIKRRLRCFHKEKWRKTNLQRFVWEINKCQNFFSSIGIPWSLAIQNSAKYMYMRVFLITKDHKIPISPPWHPKVKSTADYIDLELFHTHCAFREAFGGWIHWEAKAIRSTFAKAEAVRLIRAQLQLRDVCLSLCRLKIMLEKNSSCAEIFCLLKIKIKIWWDLFFWSLHNASCFVNLQTQNVFLAMHNTTDDKSWRWIWRPVRA